MVFGLSKDMAGDVLAIFIAVLYFQSIPRFQIIGQYFEQYPLIIFGIATLMVIKRKALIDILSK